MTWRAILACPSRMTFAVGGETQRAHRCILAARSPVFAALLEGEYAEGGRDWSIVIHKSSNV